MFDLISVRVQPDHPGHAIGSGRSILTIEAAAADDVVPAIHAEAKATLTDALADVASSWRAGEPYKRWTKLQARHEAEVCRARDLEQEADRLARAIEATFTTDDDPTPLERERVNVVADLDRTQGRIATLGGLVRAARADAEHAYTVAMTKRLDDLFRSYSEERRQAAIALEEALAGVYPDLSRFEALARFVSTDRADVKEALMPKELAAPPSRPQEPPLPPRQDATPRATNNYSGW